MADNTQDRRPLYMKIAAEIREDISAGLLKEGERAPSTHELSAFHSVNPTTSAKALTLLVEAGVLEKRRGLGMFVVHGARQALVKQRIFDFNTHFIQPMLAEANALGLENADVDKRIALLRRSQG